MYTLSPGVCDCIQHLQQQCFALAKSLQGNGFLDNGEEIIIRPYGASLLKGEKRARQEKKSELVE